LVSTNPFRRSSFRALSSLLSSWGSSKFQSISAIGPPHRCQPQCQGIPHVLVPLPSPDLGDVGDQSLLDLRLGVLGLQPESLSHGQVRDHHRIRSYQTMGHPVHLPARHQSGLHPVPPHRRALHDHHEITGQQGKTLQCHLLQHRLQGRGLLIGTFVRERLRLRAEGTLEDHSDGVPARLQDRKSTRLNSSHVKISYAVFCLKNKTRYATTVLTTHPLSRPLLRRRPSSTLFPYTTLFRSHWTAGEDTSVPPAPASPPGTRPSHRYLRERETATSGGGYP